MPLNTDLSKAPHFDDHDPSKQFAKVLFKPGYNVQTRELNQLQTLLQRQIEYFGDNIFTRGTIVDGCNFIFIPSYPYAKLMDVDTDGLTVNPVTLINRFVVNRTNGLRARVIDAVDGFESTDPDLKTLYLSYLNSGSGGQQAFASGDYLDVIGFNDSILKIKINNGALAFTNSDAVIVSPAIVVDVNANTFANGQYLVNAFGANSQIVGITAVSANSSILRLKPRDADLANSAANTLAWTFANNQAVRNSVNTATANIIKIVGSGLTAAITTNDLGKVSTIAITNNGQGYTTAPIVRVRSANNTTGLTNLNLEALNAQATIQVSSVANSVGSGYAFAISEGVAYQKGYFIPVKPQTVIVSKYSTIPSDVVVGFKTIEQVIDSNQDQSLLDNAYTSDNENAPGADRLKLMPVLEVLSKASADANSDFFTLVEWSEGQAFRQKPSTSYSKIGDEMAKRTAEQSGNFVVDKFLVTSRSPLNANLEANTVSIIVDPGVGYISGYRVETLRNYTIDVPKGITTQKQSGRKVAMDFGNYIRINNVAGLFQYNTGDTIDLYDTARNATASVASVETITTAGTKIGTARIRSLLKDVDANTYRLYLFDVRMNAGRNFSLVRSVYYNGTSKGIADLVLNTSGAAELIASGNSKLMFSAGVESPAVINAISYVYRTLDQSATVANTGLLTLNLSGSPTDTFNYSTTLSPTELQSLYVVPLDNDLVGSNAIATSVTCNTTSTTVATGSTTIPSLLQVGDYVYVAANTTVGEIALVKNIINTSSFTVGANLTFAVAGTGSLYRAYAKNSLVPFGHRTILTANNNANGNIMTLNFGERFAGATSSRVAVGYDVLRNGVTPSAKSATRSRFVKINIANNAHSTSGPWCLGVPDAFRLRNVYVGSNTSVDTTATNITHAFMIDHNQTPDYYDLSWLTLKPKSQYAPSSGQCLLVEFDYFVGSNNGFYTINSYVDANTAARFTNDSKALADLGSAVNTWEIPEVVDQSGNSVDLINTIDFRPSVEPTASPAATAASAPINPVETLSFGNTASPSNDKRFPLPYSPFRADIEYFLGRTDSVVVNKNGSINVIAGRADEDRTKRSAPDVPLDAMKIADIDIPAYPGLPILPSGRLDAILNTNVSNIKFLKQRFERKTISRNNVYEGKTVGEQPRVYTNSDVANIDRRLRDVEYYVSLTALESDLKNRAIPSSVDPTLDRFKNGFFVDDFRDYKYGDREDPQYAAFVENNALVPEKMGWSVTIDAKFDTGYYIDYDILSQLNATLPPNTPEFPCIPSTTIANILAFRAFNQTSRIATTYDSYQLTMASAEAAPATLFFYAYDNPIRIEIYQGSTLIRSTDDATTLTAADQTRVVSDEAAHWFDDQPTIYMQPFQTVGDKVIYAGKIIWTHNPTAGRIYTVRVYREDYTTRWRYLIDYPIDRSTVGCPTLPPTDDFSDDDSPIADDVGDDIGDFGDFGDFGDGVDTCGSHDLGDFGDSGDMGDMGDGGDDGGGGIW